MESSSCVYLLSGKKSVKAFGRTKVRHSVQRRPSYLTEYHGKPYAMEVLESADMYRGERLVAVKEMMSGVARDGNALGRRQLNSTVRGHG
jgi:hypothetical protein